MIGTFTYRRGPGSGKWVVAYRGPFDDEPSTLCYIEKDDSGKWVVPLPNRSLGPFKTRWRAGYAYLKSEVLGPKADALEREVLILRDACRGYRRNTRLTAAQAAAIYDVLVSKCQAASNWKDGFVTHASREDYPLSEWSFGGIVGAKFYNTSYSWYVASYVNDPGPEERIIVAETNKVLLTMYQDAFGVQDGG